MQDTQPKPGSDGDHRPFAGRLSDAWPDPRLATILAQRVRGMLPYFDDEIRMDRAHTVMLAETGIIAPHEAAAILGVLTEVSERGVDPASIDGTKSTLFWVVEAALIDRLGVDIGGKMHTGRSHNDILPTLSRMRARRLVLEVSEALLTLRRALLTQAEMHVNTVMPGYTALQHGQPWTFGHYLLGWDQAFQRDLTRLQNAWRHINRSSLGGSALAGSSWPLDRARTAALLGFDGIVRHSRDAGFGTKDHIAESIAAVSILMSNLSTLCGDLLLWSSYEFGMLEIADGFCGTSSIMPQKKNAWALDWTRGAAGQSVGQFAACLATLRGTTSTDAANQEYPDWGLAENCEHARDHLLLVGGVIEQLKVNRELMLERARANWTTASNLADAIVRHAGLSFRAAHSVVGRIVREAGAAGLGPQQVDAVFVDRIAVQLAGRAVGMSDAQLQEALDPLQFVATRVTAGSVNPQETLDMLGEANTHAAQHATWTNQRREQLRDADHQLEIAVRHWQSNAGDQP